MNRQQQDQFTIFKIWSQRKRIAEFGFASIFVLSIGLFFISRYSHVFESRSLKAVAYFGFIVLAFLLFGIRKTLKCPSCNHPLWSLRIQNYHHCGVSLLDRQNMGTMENHSRLVSQDQALMQLNEKLRPFHSLKNIFRFLHVALILAVIAVGYFWLKGDKVSPLTQVLSTGALYMIAWGILSYLFETPILAWGWRKYAKCPVCTSALQPKLKILGTNVEFEMRIPKHCTHCGQQFLA